MVGKKKPFTSSSRRNHHKKAKLSRNLSTNKYFFTRQYTRQLALKSSNIPLYTASGFNDMVTVSWTDPTTNKKPLLLFKLTDLPNSTEFTALFSQYRINMVEMAFQPLFMADQILQGGPGKTDVTWSNMILTTVPCYDLIDTAAPTALNDILERQGVKRTIYRSVIKRKVYPKILRTDTNAHGGSQFDTIVSQKESLWNSTASSGIKYNGLLVSLDGKATVGALHSQDNTYVYDWEITMKYFLEFKDPK